MYGLPPLNASGVAEPICRTSCVFDGGSFLVMSDRRLLWWLLIWSPEPITRSRSGHPYGHIQTSTLSRTSPLFVGAAVVSREW